VGHLDDAGLPGEDAGPETLEQGRRFGTFGLERAGLDPRRPAGRVVPVGLGGKDEELVAVLIGGFGVGRDVDDVIVGLSA
jgi:hypothetical protein